MTECVSSFDLPYTTQINLIEHSIHNTMSGLNSQDEIICTLQQKVKDLTEDVARLEAESEKFCNNMNDSDRLCSSQMSQLNQAELELSAVRLAFNKLKEQQSQLSVDVPSTISIIKPIVNTDDALNKLILKQSKAIHRFFKETSIDWVDRSIEVGIQLGMNRCGSDLAAQVTLLRNELHQILEGHFNQVVKIQQDFIDSIPNINVRKDS